MAVPFNPTPHPKPAQEIAADLAAAVLRNRESISIDETGGKAVSEFYRAILDGLTNPVHRA